MHPNGPVFVVKLSGGPTWFLSRHGHGEQHGSRDKYRSQVSHRTLQWIVNEAGGAGASVGGGMTSTPIVIGLLPDAHRERIVAQVRRRIQRRKEVGSSV